MTPIVSNALLRTQSDDRLAALIRAGHERAFEALVERYRRSLHAQCRRVLPAERAEDVVQQAFLSAWCALRKGVEVRDMRAWLHRIARNAAVNARRRAGYDYDELRESLVGSEAPEADLERRAVMRRTLAGLAALPERQREALLQIAVEGRTHAEVAHDLGVSDGAVRQLVHRARTTLRSVATAITPMPVATWLAAVGPEAVPAGQRIAELAAGGAAAGASAGVVKSGAVALTVGALAGGVAVHRSAAEEDAAARESSALAAGSGNPRRAAVPAGGDERRARVRSRRERRRSGRRDPRGGDAGAGRRRGGAEERRDDESGDRSGRGGGDNSGAESGSSGSGSSGSGSSGSGGGAVERSGSSGSGGGGEGSDGDSG